MRVRALSTCQKRADPDARTALEKRFIAETKLYLTKVAFKSRAVPVFESEKSQTIDSKAVIRMRTSTRRHGESAQACSAVSGSLLVNILLNYDNEGTGVPDLERVSGEQEKVSINSDDSEDTA